MLTSKNPTLGNVTQSRTAIALLAATLLVGGSVTEASAKSRNHRHHAKHVRQANSAGATPMPRSDPVAASGIASFYGKGPAARPFGQRFNQNAMTAAQAPAVRRSP
jgi:rare lipoprotein A